MYILTCTRRIYAFFLKFGPDILYLVWRKGPYRLVKLNNGGKSQDKFYLPIRDSLPQFDSLFMVLAKAEGNQFFNMAGEDAKIRKIPDE